MKLSEKNKKVPFVLLFFYEVHRLNKIKMGKNLVMSKGNNSSREEAKNFNEIREAREVFLFMHRDFRVSRNIRALWLFDHLNKFVSIENADFDVNSVRSIKRHSLRDFLFFYLGFYVGVIWG